MPPKRAYESESEIMGYKASFDGLDEPDGLEGHNTRLKKKKALAHSFKGSRMQKSRKANRHIANILDNEIIGDDKI
jgi:hypothetical protein